MCTPQPTPSLFSGGACSFQTSAEQCAGETDPDSEDLSSVFRSCFHQGLPCGFGTAPQLLDDSVSSSVKWPNKYICTACLWEAMGGTAGTVLRADIINCYCCSLVCMGLPPPHKKPFLSRNVLRESRCGGKSRNHDIVEDKEGVSGLPCPWSPFLLPRLWGPSLPGAAAPWPPVQLHGWGSLRPPCLSLSSLPDWTACGLTMAPTPCSPGTVPELCVQPSTASSGPGLAAGTPSSHHSPSPFPPNCPSTGRPGLAV